MAQTANPLILTGRAGATQEIFAPTPNIDTSLDFKNASVQNTDPNTKSFYVVYSAETYGTQGCGTGTSALVPSDPLCGTSASVSTNFDIRSAQGFDVANPGIVLFQHYQFLGYGVQYKYSQPDITHSFPAGQVDGASSYVCTGGVWELYTKKNYEGAMVRAEPGVNAQIGLNDKIQSVKFIRQ